MHNFLDLASRYEFLIENWKHYIAINLKISSQISVVRHDLPNLKVIWVHGDQLLMVPA
jgi:trehalose-6-phosphate synthase